MEYQVPQFIEVESKVIGPLTIKQFIYIAGTAGLCILFFFKLPFIVAALLGIPVVVLGGALAFYKMNGKPFVEILEAGFNYYIGDKFYLWKHKDPAPVAPQTPAAKAAAEAEAAAKIGTPKLTRGRLAALAAQLDVPESTNEDTEPEVLHGSMRLTPTNYDS